MDSTSGWGEWKQYSWQSSTSAFGERRDGLVLTICPPGVLGRNTVEKVSSGQTLGDCGSSAGTFASSQDKIIHLPRNQSGIMRHHSCHPWQSPIISPAVT